MLMLPLSESDFQLVCIKVVNICIHIRMFLIYLFLLSINPTLTRRKNRLLKLTMVPTEDASL